MALLSAVGGDCAGAVQFLPCGSEAPEPFVRELTAEQVTKMVNDLPTYSIPGGGMPQASLAGIEDKLLLTDCGDGRWGLPENGAASTHIIKPEPQQSAIPDLIDAEHWALRVAAAAGLAASQSRIAGAWGTPRTLAQRAVEATIEGTRSAIEQTPEPPVLRRVRANLDAFWVRKLWTMPSTSSHRSPSDTGA